MWKDWQELGLVLILGMLVASFVSTNHRDGNGSLFADRSNPVSAQAKAAKQPQTLRYQGTSDNARGLTTYVYGPARRAQMVCGEDLRVLVWKRDDHSVHMPGSCWLMPSQNGVYTTSNSV